MEEPIVTQNEPIAQPVAPTTNPEPATKPFKVYATQEEWDREMGNARKQGIKQGEKSAMSAFDKDGKFDMEALREQIKKEIAPIISNEAVEKYKKQQAMTEAERLEAERKEQLADLQKREQELNKREARQKLKEAGFTDEYIEYECSMITYDREASLGRIQKLCDFRKEETQSMQKSIMQQISEANPTIRISSSDANSLQARYDLAKKNRNMAELSMIIRQAQENGITLKN